MPAKDGVTYSYGSLNRLTSVVSGTLVATFEYPSNGRTDGLMASAENSLGLLTSSPG